MPGIPVRRAFIAFHLTLGVVLLILSVMTLRNAIAPRAGGPEHHIAILAGVEAVSALLFQFPGTLRVGGAGLLLVFAVAIVSHALRGEFPGPLFIYAAGTALVMAHGGAWGRQPDASEPAAP
jgi:multisubunit Na+/H+ antiporter MnhB subunit